MKHAVESCAGRRIGLILTLVGFLAQACDTGGGGSGIQGLSDAAPPLAEFDEQNLYRPYYATADLQRPRYLHVAITTRNGFPMVAGGTDERGLSSLDTIEIYDQSTFEKDSPKPDTGTGIWIDTNFEGDPIAFESGPRLLFTANVLADGKIIFFGGAPDFFASEIYSKPEVFDPETRTFEVVDKEMILPRFRHTSVQLNDGSIALVGGQVRSSVTLFSPFQIPGIPNPQIQIMVFASTPLSELFVPTEDSFKEMTIADTTRESKLNTPRGRAGHAMTRIAGPDRQLNSADDVFIIAGGFQTLSGEFAPRDKRYGTVTRTEAAGLTVIEFFDPQFKLFTQVSNVSLPIPRINDPHIMNLGRFNDFTLDGVKGMGNLVLITHGDPDTTCPVTPLFDELLVANYTGFGPSQGLQFFKIEDGGTGSHGQGVEYPPPPPLPILDPRRFIGRTTTNPVSLPRRMINLAGVRSEQTWLVTAAGVDVFLVPPNICVYNTTSPTMRSGCVFDPYFSLPANALGFSVRDLESQRSVNNLLGVIGAWLTLDGQIAKPDPNDPNHVLIVGFNELRVPNRWAQNVADTRMFGTNIAVAGVDGILNTPDDRLLLAGGSTDYEGLGGEPTAPSAEVLIVPGSNDPAPSQ